MRSRCCLAMRCGGGWSPTCRSARFSPAASIRPTVAAMMRSAAMRRCGPIRSASTRRASTRRPHAQRGRRASRHRAYRALCLARRGAGGHSRAADDLRRAVRRFVASPDLSPVEADPRSMSPWRCRATAATSCSPAIRGIASRGLRADMPAPVGRAVGLRARRRRARRCGSACSACCPRRRRPRLAADKMHKAATLFSAGGREAAIAAWSAPGTSPRRSCNGGAS